MHRSADDLTNCLRIRGSRWPGAIAALAGFVALASWSSGVAGGGDGDGSRLSVVQLGSGETVFDTNLDSCAKDDIPDTALHVFRRADGQLIGFDTYTDWRRFLVSPDGHFVRDCNVAFASTGDGDPAHFNDKLWIGAPWTEDGQHIVALGHNEYHGQTHPGACRFSTPYQCWYNSIVLLKSDDGGGHFAPIPQSGPIATASFKFDAYQGLPRGFFDPTNLIAKDGWYYAIIFTNGGGSQKRGNCLFRSNDVGNHRAWQYWTGTDFAASTFDPYTKPETAAPPPCEPISGLPGRVGSIVRHTSSGLYVSVLASQGPSEPTGRIGLVFSRDLLVWSGFTKLMDVVMIWSKSCSSRAHFGYPSLVDLAATDRNLTEIGNEPYLYMTELPLTGCATTLDRKLVRYKLELGLPTAKTG
jgi:hypothetical protein